MCYCKEKDDNTYRYNNPYLCLCVICVCITDSSKK